MSDLSTETIESKEIKSDVTRVDNDPRQGTRMPHHRRQQNQRRRAVEYGYGHAVRFEVPEAQENICALRRFSISKKYLADSR